MKRAIIVAAVLMAACAQPAPTYSVRKFEDQVRAWIGHAEENLIRQLGPPTRQYDSGGSRFLTYVDGETYTTQGTAPAYTARRGYGGTIHVTPTYPGTAPETFRIECVVTFEVRDRKIVDYRYQGNGCVAE